MTTMLSILGIVMLLLLAREFIRVAGYLCRDACDE